MIRREKHLLPGETASRCGRSALEQVLYDWDFFAGPCDHAGDCRDQKAFRQIQQPAIVTGQVCGKNGAQQEDQGNMKVENSHCGCAGGSGKKTKRCILMKGNPCGEEEHAAGEQHGGKPVIAAGNMQVLPLKGTALDIFDHSESGQTGGHHQTAGFFCDTILLFMEKKSQKIVGHVIGMAEAERINFCK